MASNPSGIQLREWRRDGWTYHAKGIWAFQEQSDTKDGAAPTVTVAGSSNFSTRSATLDTELGFFMYTNSLRLRELLQQEVHSLFYAQLLSGRSGYISRVVDEDVWSREKRRVRWLAKLLVQSGVKYML